VIVSPVTEKKVDGEKVEVVEIAVDYFDLYDRGYISMNTTVEKKYKRVPNQELHEALSPYNEVIKSYNDKNGS